MNKFFEDLTPLEERLINRKRVRYAHLWEKAAGGFITFNPSGACSWRELGRDWLWEETWPCNHYLKITPAISLGCINGTANNSRQWSSSPLFVCSRQLRTYSARLQEANGINHGSTVEATTNKVSALKAYLVPESPLQELRSRVIVCCVDGRRGPGIWVESPSDVWM